MRVSIFMLGAFVLDILLDAGLDTAKMLPFLFFAYAIIEYIEQKYSKNIEGYLSGGGRFGFVTGAVLGLVPQCGFSAMAASLYASKAITAGTIIAVFLSTSDEAIPVLLASSNSGIDIALLLGAKLIVALIAGFMVDFILKRTISADLKGGYTGNGETVECEKHIENDSILVSAVKHTLRIGVFVFIVNLVLGAITGFVGEEAIAGFISGWGFLQPVIAGLIGLIPNCAISIALTQLYAVGTLSFGGMLAGLCTGAGAGLLVLIRTNKNVKQNVFIVGSVYVTGVLAGLIAQLF